MKHPIRSTHPLLLLTLVCACAAKQEAALELAIQPLSFGCPPGTQQEIEDTPEVGHAWCVDAENRRHGSEWMWWKVVVDGQQPVLQTLWQRNELVAKIQYRASGEVQLVETYRNGMLDGLQRSWFADGSLSTVDQYMDGVRHGVSASWYANGRPRSEARYWMGRMTGTARRWSSDGSLVEEHVFTPAE